MPILQRVLTIKSTAREQSILVVVLAPSKELCHQIYSCFTELGSSCTRDIQIVDISSHSDVNSVKSVLNERPDIVIATPARILNHLEEKTISLKDSLEMLVIDEADLVFSFGFEKDLKNLLGHLPRIYQSILASATLSEEVMELKKLVLHNPVILKLQEPMVPSSCQLAHYVIRVSSLLYKLLCSTLVTGQPWDF